MLSFIEEKVSCWEKLSQEKRPIFMYGMGNGALKIMSVMSRKKIHLEGIFASDDFVRGHSFEGYRVQKLSEIEEKYDDFVIVLAFAVNYREMIDRVYELAEKYTLYVPDVPVVGGGLFTYEYCEENADKIEEVYNSLSDDLSRRVYSDIINFRISGDIRHLTDITTPREEIYKNIIKPSNAETYVDLGAYNGDTIREFLEFTKGRFKKIYAFEPDRKNFKKLNKYTENIKNIETINAVAWAIDTELPFSSKSGRQSALSPLADTMVQALSVDSVLDKKPATIIKMDVEGFEREAIWGASYTISHYTPKMMVAIYHRNEDIFELPLLIKSINPSYKFYIRHQMYIPAWETNLYVTT